MRKRKTYFDILKLISIWLVLYVHTGERAMYAYASTTGFNHWLSFLIRPLAAMGPGLFFLLSGGLLLGKEEDLKTLFCHRVLRYVAVIVVFSLFQRFYWACVSETYRSFSFVDSIKAMYSHSVITQYWFLYSYLGMLLMLPFLRYVARALTKETALYLVVLAIIFGELIPIFEIITDWDKFNVSLEILSGAVLWPLLGYIFDNTLEEWILVRRNRIAVYSFGLVVYVVNIVYTHHTYVNSGNFEDIGLTPTFLGIALLVFIKSVFAKKDFSARSQKLLKICGEGIFLVYLLEPQFRGWFEFIYDGLAPMITWFPATIIWLSVSAICGIVIAWLVHLIPGTKKFV